MQDDAATFRLVVRCMLAGLLIFVVAAAAFQLLHLLVLVFGAAVVGVLIAGFAEALARHAPLRGGWALAGALAIIMLVVAGVVWLFGRQIQDQMAQLVQSFPAAWDMLRQKVQGLPGGDQLMASLSGGPAAGGEVLSKVSMALRSAASALTDLLLLLFGAVFIAINPSLYRHGLVKLVPKRYRSQVDDVLVETTRALRKWMLGQFVSMGLIGVLTGLGLWLIGVPSPVALGLIAGVAEIIPWAGPIIASVPILIMALTVDPQTALLALAVVLVVQQIEGSLIMPYVQKEAVSLPPALTIFGVVAGGMLFGTIGLIFAAPLLVVSFVLVKRLYVEALLDTPTSVPGAEDGSER